MNVEDIAKGFEPVMKMAAESNLWVKTLMRHYRKSMSELTGKSEDSIIGELNELFEEVKEEQVNKIKKDGNKS